MSFWIRIVLFLHFEVAVKLERPGPNSTRWIRFFEICVQTNPGWPNNRCWRFVLGRNY